jgi:hypothetical protein
MRSKRKFAARFGRSILAPLVVLLILVSGHVEVASAQASAQCDSYARSSARNAGPRGGFLRGAARGEAPAWAGGWGPSQVVRDGRGHAPMPMTMPIRLVCQADPAGDLHQQKGA